MEVSDSRSDAASPLWYKGYLLTIFNHFRDAAMLRLIQIHISNNKVVGSSINSLTLTRNVTEVEPSIMRWS